ncbi:MAG: hypothetical protein ABJA57_01920 [Ginsengibacter sp.]
MKTADVNHICPYPGLRSFTEEESLYFKGRDLQVDQITALLEKNKFLMITGASGEGKSSLTYAGLIPNARAGFFKSRYSNWVVASFRPERSPVTNMSGAIAEQFNASAATVETELRRGFSSLVDLYTNSDFYAGDEDENWTKLQDNEKKERKRKAANLLILVDQFEEFFTNPENFFNEAPSKDSQIVINLILETARIAISKNLPVYIVCTMRSDYIGQCSAFRGLPEYIGFSQFFVPRLKRRDLKQVIEEPAILSGNRISQRLIERLVFDIADGVDQLPILQHALSQVWLAADHGNEEMDLVHYAMAGGMMVNELPDEDKEKFDSWFSKLPSHHRNFYQDTGLNKVIEIHANLLYENAWEYYNKENPEKPIAQQEAKRIIALTFSCLTKIDNSRAVRNRMTLAEITAIINAPGVTTEVAGSIINIFREEGNSFIHPFKTDDPATHVLSPDTVLDITHESLIRNWNKLRQWANKEFEFYSTYLDFKKQLDRWKKSNRSRGYLLPVGPLTYFEHWYDTCKPNTGWIMRYSGTEEEKQNAKTQAEETLNDTKLFLRKSARKEMVPRALMKYGARSIATIVAIIIMLGLSGFYWYDAEQKKNDSVLETVRNESFNLLKSKEVNITDKAFYLLTEERFHNGSLIPYLEALELQNRVKLAIEIYKQLLLFNKTNPSILKDQVLMLVTTNLTSPGKTADSEFLLAEGNKFLVLLLMDNYYQPDSKKAGTISEISEKGYNLALHYFGNTALFKPSVPSELNMAIQLWLTAGTATPDKIQKLLTSLSPLDSTSGANSFTTYYPKGSFEPNGREGMDFNEGYHTIASLYASLGDIEHVEWCFYKLLANNQRDYFELARLLNNHLNILGYLYQFGHRDKVPQFLQWIASNTKDNPPLTIYRNAVIRSGYISHLYPINIERDFYRSNKGLLYPNLCLCDRSVFDAMVEDYETAIGKVTDPSERNFLLAMNDKRKAMFYDKYWTDRKLPVNEEKLNGWLKEAVDLYSKIDTGYLAGTISTTSIYNGDGVRTKDIKRRDLLIYPDYRDGWYAWTYHTDYFFNYLQKNNLLAQFYKTGGDLQNLHYWVAKGFEWKTDPPVNYFTKEYPIPDEALNAIISFVDKHPEGNQFDKNLLYLVLSNRAFERGDSAAGLAYYHKINQSTIQRSSDRYEYLEKIFFLNMMKRLCGNLAAVGDSKEAVQFAGVFPTDQQQVFGYMHMAEKVYRQNANPLAFVYLDSAYARSKSIHYSAIDQRYDFRYNQILLLSEIGSQSLNNNANALLKDIPEANKFFGILSKVTGVAFEGNYYRAYTSIPASLTESQDLQCRNMILLEASKTKERQQKAQQWKQMDNYVDWYWDYVNYVPM